MLPFPAGIVRLLPRQGRGRSTRCEVLFLNDLAGPYHLLGLSDERMVQWQRDYGVDSLGKSPSGQYLIPEFPIFSKVAWMHVDPVIITGKEIHQLIQECEKAERLADGPEAGAFRDIRLLAQRAIELGGSLEFGHA